MQLEEKYLMYLIPLVASNDKVLTIFELLFGNFLLSSAEASFDKNEKAEFCWYFGGDWRGFWGFWELWRFWESFWDFQVYWSSKFVCCLALFPWVMRNISPILISLEEAVVQPWGWFPENDEKKIWTKDLYQVFKTLKNLCECSTVWTGPIWVKSYLF